MLIKKPNKVSLVGQWVELALEAFQSLGSLQARAEKSLEKYKGAFQAYLVKAAVISLSTFMCLAFLILGVFFLAIDYAGLSRGVVFIGGGLLGLLILRLMVLSQNKNQGE